MSAEELKLLLNKKILIREEAGGVYERWVLSISPNGRFVKLTDGLPFSATWRNISDLNVVDTLQ